MKATSGAYISRLDHLRFVAAFMVFHWHFALFNALPRTEVPSFWPISLLLQGHTGVSFFMTISGYIFSRISIGHTINYREFLRNRLYRIAPLFIVWVTVYFYLAKIDPLKLVLAIFFFLEPTVVPGNAWSVIIEFQCYLIFPFLVLFCNKYGTKYLVGLLLLSVLMKTGYWLQNGTVQNISYSTILGRLDQFLCGMIAARMAGAFAGPRGKTYAMVLTIAAALGISYVYYRFNVLGGYFDGASAGQSPRFLWVVMPALEGVFYAALVAGYLYGPFSMPHWLDAFFAKLGEISYSLYLCHAFVLASSMKLITAWFHPALTTFGQTFIFGTLVVLPLCLLFALATYYLLEKPFLGFRRNYLE